MLSPMEALPELALFKNTNGNIEFNFPTLKASNILPFGFKKVYSKRSDEIVSYTNKLASIVERYQPGYFETWYNRLVDLSLEIIDFAPNSNDLTELDVQEIDLLCDDYCKLAFDPIIIKYVSHMIEATYQGTLDEDAAQSTNKIEEIQFLDVHAKAILKTSLMYKIMIPTIVTMVLANSETKRLDMSYFINKIFTRTFTNFEDGFNIINKINKLIESRVKRSIYSNQVIWKYLQNLGQDPTSTITTIRKCLITDIMLKLDLSKNVVSLFAVVINNQLDFIFTKKFKISFRPITIDYSDNENSPLDRLEGEQTRDEGLNGILSIDIDYALDALIKHFDAGLSNVEVIYYHFLININDFQKNMVFMTLARFTGIDIDAFYGLNKKRFIEAWYCVCCILRKNNLNYLASLMLSDMVPMKRARLNRKLLNNVMSNSVYTNILESNFTVMTPRIKKHSVIFNKIMSIDVNFFKLYSTYNMSKIRSYITQKYKDDSMKITGRHIKEYAEALRNSTSDSSLNSEKFAMEYLKFIQLVC